MPLKLLEFLVKFMIAIFLIYPILRKLDQQNFFFTEKTDH